MKQLASFLSSRCPEFESNRVWVSREEAREIWPMADSPNPNRPLKCPFKYGSQHYRLMVAFSSGKTFTARAAQLFLDATDGDRRMRKVIEKLEKDFGLEFFTLKEVSQSGAKYERRGLDGMGQVKLINLLVKWGNEAQEKHEGK